MHSTQIAVRLSDELLRRLDAQIPQRFSSRAEAVREGLTALLAEESEAVRVARHRDAWERLPLSPGAIEQMRADARALIAEEPW